jgi:hypothetical protein
MMVQTVRTLGMVAVGCALFLGGGAQLQALKLEGGQSIFALRLGGSGDNAFTPAGGYFTASAAYDYMLPLGLSATTDLTLELNPSYNNVFLFGIGARYRYQGLPVPLHPHAGLQFVAGRLFNVRWVDLTYLGARLSLGGDYYLTSNWSAGLLMSVDLGGTVSTPRSAAFRQINFLVVAQYIL